MFLNLLWRAVELIRCALESCVHDSACLRDLKEKDNLYILYIYIYIYIFRIHFRSSQSPVGVVRLYHHRNAICV